MSSTATSTISRRAFVGAASVALAGALSACASGRTDGHKDAASDQAGDGTLKGSGNTLKVVCTNESYQALFDRFTEEVGSPVEFISMSSGEVLSKLRAEGGTPDADLWFGGGIDAFMSAKDDGLLEQVNFEAADRFAEGFKDEENYWFSKGVTVVGFITNNDLLAEIGAEAPASWTHLTDASLAGEVLMSSPAVSGTNYAVVNALLQSMGDDAGWEYFEALNDNIPFYTKRGSDPSTRVAAGEAAVGITYLDGTLNELLEGGDLSLVYPEDGMPYMPDGVAVLGNAENVEDAKLFVEWLFSSDENLRYLAEIDEKGTMRLCIPDVDGVELDYDASRLVEEDLSLFGTQRDEILARWDELTSGKDLVEG